ncbi:MAG TPA: hydroxymethylbilane synthase [Steroidobacteraceae bacterium]|nr:hydroxymethylbilane synthase [Steroidobacteraceae bacterium]
MSRTRALRIGTRASALALWQSREVAAHIAAQPDAPPTELVHIRTSGDVQTEIPLWQTRGRAFFTREIDRALLDGAVDIAVHSLKDLPTELDAGIALAALLPRADPRDALLSRSGATLAALPAGARIGTSSLRRRAFLARARPDIALVELRGNVPTRIERVQRGDYDAIVLAAAGVTRLGLAHHVSEYLDPETFPPAVSQGVIAVCARQEDEPTARWLAALEDSDARLSVTAERALLRHLEGGCQVPLGALATVHGGSLTLMAALCALDGTHPLSARAQAPATPAEAEALGVRVATALLERGAAELMRQERAARTVEPP